jgi:AcrR family transcriptional regulator
LEASRVVPPDPPVSARTYTMQVRQEAVDRTRLRITEAIMRLHETVGPRATTVSAIAEDAGVTWLTVYRHFPDEESLVHACSAHWSQLHPRPDPESWASIDDPVLRLQTALAQTYAWARPAAPMMTKIFQDVDAMPRFVSQFLAADEQARVAVLRRGFVARGRSLRTLEAVLKHALRLSTWQSLCLYGGLTNTEAVNIMVGAVLAVLPPNARSLPPNYM